MAGSRQDKGVRTHRAAAASTGQAGTPHEPAGWLCVAAIAGCAALYFLPLLSGSAFLWEDFLYFSYPVRVFAATSMASGQLPLWDPYTFSGMPFAADILSTVFYIPCALLALAVHDGTLSAYWLQLVIILHFLLAGVSMYVLAQEFGLRRAPALVAGVAYMLTGFMVVHAIHQHVVTLGAWIPLIVLLFRRALLEPRWTMVFLAGLVLGHSVLCGFPQLSLYIYVFLFAFWLFELLKAFPGRRLLSAPALLMSARAAAVVALSLAVAAIQLLPTMELSGLSQRATITYEFATEGSLAWSQLLTLLFPKLFGSAGAQGYAYFGPGTYWYYWETCIYLGVLPLLLMVLSLRLLRRNPYVAFFWGFALFALLFALGNNFVLHRLFFELVPGFSRFRNPARIGILFAFPAVLLGAFALQHILYGERSARETALLRRWVLGAAAAGALLWILLQTGMLDDLLPYLRNPRLAPSLSGHLLSGLVLLLVSAGALYAMLVRGAGKGWAGVALVVVLFADLYLFGGTQNTSASDPGEYFGSAGRVVHFLKQQGEKEIFRVNTRNPNGMIMDRNQGLMDRIFTMEGYNPLALQRLFIPTASNDQLFDLLNIKYKTVTDERNHALALVPHATYLPRAFFVYATHTVQSEDALLAYLKSPEFHHRTTAVLEEDPGVQLAADTTQPVNAVMISAYGNNAITLAVETERQGFLILSEAYYPGWKAYVDGAPTRLYRADYNLRGLFVPAGNHTIDVRFEPAPFRQGGLITLAALMICGVGIIVSTLRSGKAASHV